MITITGQEQLHNGFWNKTIWLGTLALLGTLLLFVGVSMSSAASSAEERLLPQILGQLDEQGKKIKSTTVMDVGGQTQITVVLLSGEVRKYNEKGQLSEVRDPYGKVTVYEDGMPSEERDASGSILARYQYYRSANGKLQKMVKRSAAGVVTKLFDDDGNPVQATDSQGTKVFSNYVKDEKGKTVGYTETDLSTNKTNRMILDPKNGEVVARIDQNNIRTDIETLYNPQGEKIQTIERDTAGNVTVKKFEKDQMVEQVENGVKTTYENILNEKGVLAQKKEIKQVATSSGMMEDVTIKDYDDQGRVVRVQDKEGEHTYTYEVNVEGRITARHELLKPVDGAKAKEKVTFYDEAGRVIGLEEEGRTTKINNILDENGNIVSSVEYVTYSFGGKVFTDTIKKTFDGKGHMLSKTDANGQRTEFSYDGNGNRIRSQVGDEITEYTYDDNNNLVSSITQDYKSRTLTEYDQKTKLAERKVMIKNSGAVEITTYGATQDGKRVYYTLTPFGIKTTVCRDSQSDQPEKVIYNKFNGKVITTNYEYAGEHLVKSTEEGPMGVTETQYNAAGKPLQSVQTDKWGRTQQTDFQYEKGVLSESLMVDKKGQTVTYYNAHGDPEKITRINTIGFPRRSDEERTYKDGILIKSVSRDVKGETVTEFDQNEQGKKIHRINKHGFPREHWVENIYDAGGDLAESRQTDSRGYAINKFDHDGLMTETERVDIHGYPKRKKTTYDYINGELVSSITDDDRGTTYNTFDKDGLMKESHRVKKYGFPREERTTYEYDANAYMVYSKTEDENGTTQNWFNIDELVAVSFRKNLYGHARDQWTVNEYDGDGFLSMSKETDLRGSTVTRFNIDGLPVESFRTDSYGVVFSRQTLTVNEFDDQGFMTVSKSKNLLTTVEKTMDRDALVQEQKQNDNYGVVFGRYKVTEDFDYDGHGRLQTNVTTDRLGQTTSTYDIHGDAVESIRIATIGLGASRESYTVATYNSDTGMTTDRLSKSNYGTTHSLNFDPVTGLEALQQINNNFGLGATRYTENQVELDERHGLTRRTLATNDYGKTETHYDVEQGGAYGIAVNSRSVTNFGLGFTRDTATAIEADINTGLNQRTKAVNKYGMTMTEFDSTVGGTYGVAISTVTENYYGLGSTRKSQVRRGDLEVNLWNGLNHRTLSRSEYGTTETWYEDGQTGVAKASDTNNNFGLGATRHSWVKEGNLEVNAWNGLNIRTFSESAYGTVETRYDDNQFGVAKSSDTKNNFGLGATRHSWINAGNLEVNTDNGLNKRTLSESAYGTTETWYEDGEYGVAKSSDTNNKFGLGATRHSWIADGNMEVNTWNGLTRHTLSESAYGTTETQFEDSQYGVAESSDTKNNFGLGATRHSWIADGNMDVNTFNGLNIHTLSESVYGTTETWYDDGQYGVAKTSDTKNNFGLGATRHSWIADGNMEVNTYNGLNIRTFSESAYGTTETWYDDGQFGVAKASDTNNNFGLGATRHSFIKDGNMEVNSWNGLNIRTFSESEYGTTETWYDDAQFGVARSSDTNNHFGLGATRHSWIAAGNMEVNTWNGLNIRTFSESAYGTTETLYEDEQYGIATSSDTKNNFGLGATRHSWISEGNMEVNTWNGLNIRTFSESAYGTTETKYDDQKYGVATSSDTNNNYGLGATRHSWISEGNMEVNTYNGLNIRTFSESAYGNTETWYEDVEYGVAKASDTNNNYGLGATRHSWIREGNMEVNSWNGLNIRTFSESAYGTTETWYDQDTYGVARASDTNNSFGLGATRHSWIADGNMEVNTWNGLNIRTFSESAYGTTETWYEDAQYGVAKASDTNNKFGLGATRHSWIKEGNMEVNTWNGLNIRTFSESAYGTTETWYEDDQYGVATSSDTNNNFGLGATRHSWIKEGDMEVNTYNGLNIRTLSESAYGTTETWYDDAQFGVAKSSDTNNNYGLGATRHSWINEGNMEVNAWNGLNIRTFSESAYGTTETKYDDQVYGVATSSDTNNNYGLGATRHSWINEGNLEVNTWNGLNIRTFSESAYGTVETWYEDGHYGVAKASDSNNNFGLGATQHSWIAEGNLEVNNWNGLNIRTFSESDYGTVETWYDQDQFGIATSSDTNNKFGLGATRHSWINEGNLEVNTYNGLNIRTFSESAYGTTETWYDQNQFGVATASDTNNYYGLGATRHSWINEGNLEVNTYNGLNIRTYSESAYGTTETWYDDALFGVAKSSDTNNNFGIGATRHSWVSDGNLEVNTWNGLNIRTFSESAYGTTQTWYDDVSYGVARSSDTNNNFGLGATQHSWINDGNLEVNTWNGLNIRTFSESAYGTTETWYDQEEYGVAESSDTNNNFGLGATRHSWISEGKMEVNVWNGLNIRTFSESAYGTNETWYDQDEYGVATSSDTHNNFGLGATRHSWISEGNLEVNTWNGMNERTYSESAYGTTETWYESSIYGVAKSSDTNNNFGIGATRHSWISEGNLEVNTWNGLNTHTFSESVYGTTETWYDDEQYGVARSSDTNNNFGLGATRHSWVSDGNLEVNTWNGLNIRTFSESAYGTTETWYDQEQYGVATASDTNNNFGIGATRHSWVSQGNMQVNTWNGLNIHTFSESAYGTTETWYDEDQFGVATSSDTNNRFGLGATRHSWISEGNLEVNTWNGLNIRTFSESAYGTTETWYDDVNYGVAKSSDTNNNYGLGATRHSWINDGNLEVNTYNGLNIRTFSESAYGTTETWYEDGEYGVAKASDTNNVFGLGATRHSWISEGNLEVNTWNGLNIRTFSESAYGTTETLYDQDQFGVARSSDTNNVFGLGATRHSWINDGNLEVNTWNGLNIRTFSESAYGTTETWYDQDQFGVARASDTNNNYGLGATRHSWINEGNLEVNTYNGLNIRTYSESAYGTTETWYDQDQFGVARSSDTNNFFGLGATRHSWINDGNLEVNTYNGLNIRTFSESAYGTTETWYDQDQFGVARASNTNNNYGLGATRHSWINDGNLEVNTYNGLNIRTFSESAYGTTETWYDQDTYGVARASDTNNNFGLGATRHSWINDGNLEVNTWNGLNIRTFSESDYGTNETWYDQNQFGVATSSDTNNFFGLGATRHSWISEGNLEVNTWNGLNIHTYSESAYGTNETWYDQAEYGVATSSDTNNNFGLGATRHSWISEGNLEVNTYNGLNIRTFSESAYGTNETWYDQAEYGVARSSDTNNFFGLGATRHSWISDGNLEVNTFNGLNIRTFSESAYGTNETWYDQDQFGVARASDTNNNFGLGATRHSWINDGNLEVNTYNGLNIRTFSESAYGTTETWYDQDQFGVARSSDTNNLFGLGATRHSWISEGNMEVNTWNGLNIRTFSESAYGTTETWYDQAEYGIATSSDTNNNFGLGATRHSWVSEGNMEVNTYNGLNIRTFSESAYGTTETLYDQDQFGVATSSDTNNFFGLGATRHSWISNGNLEVNTYNGLNIRTFSESEYGTNETWYEQDQYGVARASDTNNNFGLGATRHSWISDGNLEVNTYNGLNIRTFSESAYGTTETLYDQDTYGVARSSDTNNVFGLGATRHSWVSDGNLEVNTYNGLNIRTFSESAYGTTETWYDQNEYGIATSSDTNNNFGLGATRHSWVSDGNLEVNTWNGLNIRTFSESAYGTTETLYDQDQFGVATSSDTNNFFGLGATRHSWISNGNLEVNTYNGLNIRTFSESLYGTTETWYDQAEYGVARASDTNNNFGLGATRHSWINDGNLEVNTYNGLNIRTFSESEYGTTETWYEDGQYGVARASDTNNNFGIGATRHSWINDGNLEVNTYNGLNIRTFSESEYGTTETWYEDGQYGVARSSDTNNNFGLGATRHSWISDGNLQVNTFNGLNIRTFSESLYGTTETLYDQAEYGVATSSDTNNNFGLGATRHSWISDGNMEVNTYNGLNIRTFSESEYGTTETWYDQADYGVATSSDTNNNFGLGATRHSWVANGNLNVNTWNGLNTRTFSESAYGTTETFYDDAEYGVAKSSDTNNLFGLGATRHSWVADGNLDVNTYNGLNRRTLSESEYGTTETWYEDGQYGVARASDTNNNFGLGATQHSWISDGNLEVNTYNGLNIRTFSESLYGTTETLYDQDEFGTAKSSDTNNNFGLGATRHSWVADGNLEVNTWNGLNARTFSESLYGTTETLYDQNNYGTAKSSDTNNFFGLGATRHSWISDGNLDVNTYNGLNRRTFSESDYGTTETQYDDTEFGTAKSSDTNNLFGLGATRHSWISDGNLEVNTWNGLNARTFSESDYGTTETRYDDAQFGVAISSDTNNLFGLGATRHSWISEGNLQVNTYNGLNIRTFSESDYGTTETLYDQNDFGVAKSSDTNNNFGLGLTRHSWISDGNMSVNTYNGLNIRTFSESDYGTTETLYDQDEFGVPTSSDTNNKYGLGATRHSWISDGNMVVNTFNGLNIRTFSESDYGTTETWYDDAAYGTAKASDTNNKFGLGLTRHSWISDGNMTVNPENGLNVRTFSESDYGTTETLYESESYGTPKSSDTNNNYGLGLTRHSWISDGNMDVNPDNGLNIRTFSESDYGTTETFYTGDSFGVADTSHTINKYGLGHTQDTQSDLTVDTTNGLTISSHAVNLFGTTDTYYTRDSYGVADWSQAHNEWGVFGERDVRTEITADTNTGLNTTTVATTSLRETTTHFTADSYGVADWSLSVTDFLPTLAQSTRTEITASEDTGLNMRSVAVNGLSTTTTDEFDGTYGVAKHMTTYNNYCTGEGNRNVETKINANTDTGLNIDTYSRSYGGGGTLSETWTLYTTNTGTQTTAKTVMNAAWTLGFSVNNNVTYQVNQTTGKMIQSSSYNDNGYTITNYDGEGLPSYSDNYAYFGVSDHTHSDIEYSTATGITSRTVGYSYSKFNGGLLNTTTTVNDANGVTTDITTVSTFGATRSRTSTTKVTGNYSFTGSKQTTSTTTGLGTSTSDYNQMGVEMHSENIANIGPTEGRTSNTYTTNWNQNTGIRRIKYTGSNLSSTWTWSDENGLPRASLYKENTNVYGSAAGARYSKTDCNGIHWNGNPSDTFSDSPGHSDTTTTYDEDGFTQQAITDSIYGAKGMEYTITNFVPDPSTGMNRSSHMIKADGRGYSDNTYNTTFGVVSVSDDTDKEGNTTHTTYNWNDGTGMTTHTVSTGEGGYWEGNTQYDSHGRKTDSQTHRDKQSGKKKVTEIYNSHFRNNDWTGFKEYEWRTNVANSKDEEIQYDMDGLEMKNKITDYRYPTGEVLHVTAYNGYDGDDVPTGSTETFGGDRQTLTIVNSGYVESVNPDKSMYMPTSQSVTYHQANYITSATITYSVNLNGPVSAHVSDNQGQETWAMDEGYENAAITSRSRTNNDGSTYNVNYSDTPPNGAQFHTAANITYTDYMGMHNGSGTETYTSTGILTQKVLNNSDTMNQTLSYSNDGQYVTTATGQREDKESVSYVFTGVNEYASFSDDKGITTWNPATQKMLTSAGGVGTFSYTYAGAKVDKIQGTSGRDGQLLMDKWWNVKTWTDSMGVVHSYTGTSLTKGYWTKAHETFTDKGGGSWQGDMNYGTYGFYFKGGRLNGTKAKVDATGAKNTVDMDDGLATTNIKTQLKSHNTARETWTWSAPDDVGVRTLGDWQAEYMQSGDLTQFADVIVTINEDGSTTSIFSNIRFNKSNFYQRDRYKPTSDSNTWSTISDDEPSTWDTRNYSMRNNKFSNAKWGELRQITDSERVQVGTKTVTKTRTVTKCDTSVPPVCKDVEEEYEVEEPVYSTKWYMKHTNYTKGGDGWMWWTLGTKTEQFYADTMAQNTGNIIAGGVGSKGQVSGSSVMTYRLSSGNKAGGVLLAGGMEDQQSGKGRLEQPAVPAPEAAAEVAAAAVEPATTPVVGKARGGEPAEEAEADAEKASTQDELLAAFANIKSLADVVEFLKLALAKLGQEAVAAALQNSGAAQLLEQLVKASQLVFGGAAQESLLGKLTSLLLDNQQMVDEVRLAITGGEVISDEVKQATKIAESMKFADVVSRDENGRVVEAVDHNGAMHTFKYEAGGFTETTKDSAGNVQVAQYNQAGRLVAVNEGGTTRTYAYADGKVTVTERTEAGEVTMQYGSDGRLVSLEADGQKTTYQYSGQGTGNYTALVVGQNGKMVEQKTYRDGRLVAKQMQDGSKVAYDYQTDAAGEVLAITRVETDAQGNQMVMKFDKSGRLISVKGKDGEQQVAEAEGMSEKALEFIQFELFGDPRVDSMRIDNKLLQGFEQK
jgi:YD repeat-containing protein